MINTKQIKSSCLILTLLAIVSLNSQAQISHNLKFKHLNQYAFVHCMISNYQRIDSNYLSKDGMHIFLIHNNIISKEGLIKFNQYINHKTLTFYELSDYPFLEVKMNFLCSNCLSFCDKNKNLNQFIEDLLKKENLEKKLKLKLAEIEDKILAMRKSYNSRRRISKLELECVLLNKNSTVLNKFKII